MSFRDLFKIKNQLRFLKYKKNIILSSLAIALKNSRKKGNSIYDIWMYQQSDEIQLLAKIPLLFQPSTKWRYSVSMDVLGRILEVVLKTS